MNTKKVFEDIYKNPEGAGWLFNNPSVEFIKFINSGKIKPCKVLDVGCGEGYYSIYLASKGFEVTGIDWSEKAIELAKEHAEEAEIKCKFLAVGIEDMISLGKFDFIFDWRFLHDIPEKNERIKYVKIVQNMLNVGGKYLSVSFSTDIGKESETIKSGRGISVYLSSMEDMEKLFENFKVIEKKSIRIERMRGGERSANYFFMESV